MNDEFDTLRHELAGARLDGLRWVPGAAVQARRRTLARSAIVAGLAVLLILGAALAPAAL